MPTELEALTQGLNDICDERLGDSITITPPASLPIGIVAHVDYGEEADMRGMSSVIIQQVVIDLDKGLLPGKPGTGWRVTLPRLPGQTFEPKGVIDDPKGAGLRWLFTLKEVAGA